MDTASFFALANLPGPSGSEKAVTDFVIENYSRLFDEFRTDALGNLIGISRSGRENAPLLMIDAHCDEVGLIITSVTDEGFLKFNALGSPDVRTLINAEVTVLGRENLPGIVCTLPPHLQTASEMETYPKLTDLSIDIGMSSEEAEKLVSPGDCAVLAAKGFSLLNGRLAGKAFDNRLCLRAALAAVEAVSGEKRDFDIALTLTVCEETGCVGAGPAAFSLSPDACIVLDVTFGSQPDAPGEATFDLGSGVTLCVGPFTDRTLTDRLFDLAGELEIGCSPEVYGTSTGTNATPVQITRCGIPTAVISVPIRNMHTPVEVCDPSDSDAAAKLLSEFIRRTKGDDLR